MRSMSWRRFVVLLRGLSAESVWVQTLHAQRHDKRAPLQAVDATKRADRGRGLMLSWVSRAS